MVRLKVKHLADEDRPVPNKWQDAKGVSLFSRQTGRKERRGIDFALWRAESCGPGKYYTVTKGLPLIQGRAPCHSLGFPDLPKEKEREPYGSGMESPTLDFVSTHKSPVSVRFPAVGRDVVPSFTNTVQTYEHGLSLPSYVGKTSPTRHVNHVNFKKQIYRDRKAPWVLLAERRDSQREVDAIEAAAQQARQRRTKAHRSTHSGVEAIGHVPSRSTSPAYLADLKWVGPQAAPRACVGDDSDPMARGIAPRDGGSRRQRSGTVRAEQLKRGLESRAEWINAKFRQLLHEDVPWSAAQATADGDEKCASKALKGDRHGQWQFKSRDRGLVPDPAQAKPDPDTMTREWLRRNYSRLLHEEMELTKSGMPPPMPVREYVADSTKACYIEPITPVVGRDTAPHSVSMNLTAPRSPTVSSLTNNPSRSKLKRITRQIEKETIPARKARPAQLNTEALVCADIPPSSPAAPP